MIPAAVLRIPRHNVALHVEARWDGCPAYFSESPAYFDESELIYPSTPPVMTWVQPPTLSSVITFVPTLMVLSNWESASGAKRIAVFGSDTVIWLVCSPVGLMSAGWGTLNGGGKACKEVV